MLRKEQNKRRINANEQGFSIIEVLVALALVSVLSGLFIGSIGQVRSIILTTSKIDADVELAALTNYLSGTLERVRLLPLLSERSTQGAALTGAIKDLKFVGIDRIGSEDFALREIHFLTRRGRAGNLELVQASHPRRSSAVNSPLITPLAEIDDIEFEYRANDGWRRDWSEARPPLAVKVTVTLTRKGQRVASTKTMMLPGR